MTRQILFVLTVAAALSGCASANDFSTGSQRSIDADIAAAHDQGPTATSENSAEVTFAPQLSVPLKSAY
ncbi:MAG: hypothetical protein ABSC26_08965 [Stellaceae bacterium]|jgi:uncharacterized protein YceK